MKAFASSDKIGSVLNYIQQNYVDSIDRKIITEEIIPDILKKLDPHSFYIPPREVDGINETLRGNFDGIGVQFNMRDDTVLVIQTIKGGPSEKVGILAGDRIISVDGVTVAGVDMPEDSIIGSLRGPKGSTVTVGVYRRGDPDTLRFEISRGTIPVHSVDVSYMIDKKIGYMKINTFSQSSYQEFSEGLTKLKEQGCRKLILDLRGNTGGIMEPAIRMADDFLDEGSLIVYTEGNARKREEYRATRHDLGKGIDVAVLIDEGSASASEIVAGAIQDNDRGWIFGRRSFGKGLVQEQAMLSDGSAIRLTTARYYTPTGRSIQKPYNGNRDAYYHDLSRRYRSGEMTSADSVHFNDSLKFTTPEGRTVYGGGGIMPDFFVPYDTTGITPFFMRINQTGLIYRFALQYADDNREALIVFKEASEIDDYLESEGVFNLFKSYLRKKGYFPNPVEWNDSQLIISTQLHAYIARNILDNEGFYPIIKRIDNTLIQSIAFFSK